MVTTPSPLIVSKSAFKFVRLDLIGAYTQVISMDPTMAEVWAARTTSTIVCKEIGLFDFVLEGDAM
jgi:hypothetical protein